MTQTASTHQNLGPSRIRRRLIAGLLVLGAGLGGLGGFGSLACQSPPMEGAASDANRPCGDGLVCDIVQGRCVSSDPAIRYCTGDGWCWQSPSPQGNPLRATWVSDANNLWAVGDAGTIV